MFIHRWSARIMRCNRSRLGLAVALGALLLAASGCAGELANIAGPSFDDDENIRRDGPPGFALAGQVTSADDGAALADAWVMVESLDGMRRARTDNEGAYRVEGLTGEVEITAIARGYEDSERYTIEMEDDVFLEFELQVDDGDQEQRVPTGAIGS